MPRWQKKSGNQNVHRALFGLALLFLLLLPLWLVDLCSRSEIANTALPRAVKEPQHAAEHVPVKVVPIEERDQLCSGESLLVKYCSGTSWDVEAWSLSGDEQMAIATCTPCDTINEICQFDNLPHGLYAIWQGWHSTRTEHTGNLAQGEQISLFCPDECSLRLSVVTSDSCSKHGKWTIYGRPGGPLQNEVVVEGDWVAGKTETVSGLPCIERAVVEVSGNGCGTQRPRVSLNDVSGQVTVDLTTLYSQDILVLDRQTGEPIQGAVVVTVNGIMEKRTDTTGFVTVTSPSTERSVIVVRAEHYAPRSLSASEWYQNDLDDIIEVPLYPVFDSEIRCWDRGDICDPTVSVFVDSRTMKADVRRCSHVGDGIWNCPVREEGDRVYAKSGSRSSQVEWLSPGEEADLVIPPTIGAFCLSWPRSPDGQTSCVAHAFLLESELPVGARVFTIGNPRPGEEIDIPTPPGSWIDIILQCGDYSWSGNATSSHPGASTCTTVRLQENGYLCKHDGPSTCSALWYGSANLSWLQSSFSSCSDSIQPGNWTVKCGGDTKELLVEPGETTSL